MREPWYFHEETGKTHAFETAATIRSVCGQVLRPQRQQVPPGFNPCGRCQRILDQRAVKEAEEDEREA